MSKPTLLRFAHCSMQYSDTTAQMNADVDRLLGRDYDVLTFTEAGNNALNTLFKTKGAAAGYHVHIRNAVGVAIKADRIAKHQPGPRDGYLPILTADQGIGNHPPVGVAWVSWWDKPTGRKITYGAGHWLTKGRWPSDANHALNVKVARETGDFLTDKGAGPDLGFFAADTNIVDANRDIFFGEPVATCWDDIGKHPNTGHGNIDVIARYEGDKAVTCVGARVLDDRALHLNTDHFLIESTYRVLPQREQHKDAA